MKRLAWAVSLAVCLVIVLTGCAGSGPVSGGSGWETLIDGSSGRNNFNLVGPDVWTTVAAEGGYIQGSRTGEDRSYLVSENSYRDFEMRVEFWASDDANSGVFIRCDSPHEMTSRSCYEVNIFDQRPNPAYSTGGIVRVAETSTPAPKAGGKWNTMVITAQGDRLRVVLNGAQTVDVRDSTHADGVFSLQWGKGVVRFRKVEIRSL